MRTVKTEASPENMLRFVTWRRMRCVEQLGELLSRLRTAKGMKSCDVARAIGISSAYYSELENGRHCTLPSEQTAWALADVLDGDFDEIMQRAGRVPGYVVQEMIEDPWKVELIKVLIHERISGEEALRRVQEVKR